MVDKTSRSLLVYIRKQGVISDADIKKRFESDLTSEITALKRNKYISDTITEFDWICGIPAPGSRSYEITPEGRAYLENRVSEKAFKLVPIIISILALILSAFNTLKIYGVF